MTAESAPPLALDGGEGLVDALVQTSFVTMAVLTQVGSAHDLSLTQLRLLGILRDRTVRVSALAEYLGLEKSTLSGLVDRAARRGLVDRRPHAGDRRVVEIALTPAGAALAESVHGAVAHALEPVSAGLGAPERRRLYELLARMLGTRPA